MQNLKCASGFKAAVALAAVLITGCWGSVEFTGDAWLDTAGPDTAVDTGSEVDPDVLPPDTIDDTLPDPYWDTWEDPWYDTWEDPWYDVPPDPYWDTWEDPWYDTWTDPWYDVPPDTIPSCVVESCALVDASVGCCPGLVPVDPCSASDPSCAPGSLFCVNCGNGSCDPWENLSNCAMDCAASTCSPGTGYAFSCSEYEWYSCECQGDPCTPTCSSSGGMGQWMDPCTGDVISTTPCVSWVTPECLYQGSESEGWYVYTPWGDEILISYDDCGGELVCY